jgi:hypothetical protein
MRLKRSTSLLSAVFYIAPGQGLCLGSSKGAKAQAADMLLTAPPQRKQKETKKKLLRDTIYQRITPRAQRLNRPSAPIYFYRLCSCISLKPQQLHSKSSGRSPSHQHVPGGVGMVLQSCCTALQGQRMNGWKQQRYNKLQKYRGNSEETKA